MRVILEFFLLSFAVWGLNLVAKRTFLRKGNKVTSAILSFVVVGLVIFLLSPYFVKDVNPAWLFTPMLLFLLVRDIKDSLEEKR